MYMRCLFWTWMSMWMAANALILPPHTPMMAYSSDMSDGGNENQNPNPNSNPSQNQNQNKLGQYSVTDNLSIYFYGPVSDTSCLQLTQALNVMDLKANQQKVMNSQLKPFIPLHIQSGGGSLMPSFYICDLIKNTETPVHTYVDGFCASAASLISICGSRRLMTRHSSMLIHQLTGVASGKFNEVKTEVGNLNFFMNHVRRIYLENTKLDEETLDGLLKTDIWLDAETCLEYGLVDEII